MVGGERVAYPSANISVCFVGYELEEVGHDSPLFVR